MSRIAIFFFYRRQMRLMKFYFQKNIALIYGLEFLLNNKNKNKVVWLLFWIQKALCDSIIIKMLCTTFYETNNNNNNIRNFTFYWHGDQIKTMFLLLGWKRHVFPLKKKKSYALAHKANKSTLREEIQWGKREQSEFITISFHSLVCNLQIDIHRILCSHSHVQHKI